MAVGFTIGIGAFLSDSAIKYFKQFKRLPPRDLDVSGVTAISGVASLETLLNAVSASSQNSFLIYAHGQPDGSGLYMQIASRRGNFQRPGTSACGLRDSVSGGSRTEPSAALLAVLRVVGHFGSLIVTKVIAPRTKLVSEGQLLDGSWPLRIVYRIVTGSFEHTHGIALKFTDTWKALFFSRGSNRICRGTSRR